MIAYTPGIACHSTSVRVLYVQLVQTSMPAGLRIELAVRTILACIEMLRVDLVICFVGVNSIALWAVETD